MTRHPYQALAAVAANDGRRALRPDPAAFVAWGTLADADLTSRIPMALSAPASSTGTRYPVSPRLAGWSHSAAPGDAWLMAAHYRFGSNSAVVKHCHVFPVRHAKGESSPRPMSAPKSGAAAAAHGAREPTP
jgi:hypothetical protein